MPNWGFWEWLTYGCIAIAAVILTGDAAIKGSPEMISQFSGLLRSGWWNYAPLALMIASGVLLVANRLGYIGTLTVLTGKPAHVAASRLPTRIRLQFFGDQRIPVAIGDGDNVAAWFAYYSSSMLMTPFDAEGQRMPGGWQVPPSWAIFIVLDRPTDYRQVIVTFSNPDIMPQTEVRMTHSRCIVVTTRSQVPAGVLDIHAETH